MVWVEEIILISRGCLHKYLLNTAESKCWARKRISKILTVLRRTRAPAIFHSITFAINFFFDSTQGSSN
jgi:hypothetical protein